jgi:hypothetical protein
MSSDRFEFVLILAVLALAVTWQIAGATKPEMTTETLGPFSVSIPSVLDNHATAHGPEHGLTSEGKKAEHYYIILDGVPYGDYPPTTIINTYQVSGLENASETEDELRDEMIANNCDPLTITTETMTIDNHPTVVGWSKNDDCGPNQLIYMGSYSIANDTSVNFYIRGDWSEIFLLRENLHVALTK